MALLLRMTVFFLLLPTARASLADFYLVSTDITGANTQLDVDHSSIWLFTPATSWYVAGAKFVMKEGGTSSAATSLTLWEGVPSSGTIVAQRQLTETQFCAETLSSCQSYVEHDYLFSTPYTTVAGHTYVLVLNSTASTAGSKQYFIKGNGAPTAYFYNATVAPGTIPGSGTALPTDSLTGPISYTYGDPQLIVAPSVATPEPLSFLLTACGMLALAVIGRSKRAV